MTWHEIYDSSFRKLEKDWRSRDMEVKLIKTLKKWSAKNHFEKDKFLWIGAIYGWNFLNALVFWAQRHLFLLNFFKTFNKRVRKSWGRKKLSRTSNEDYSVSILQSAVFLLIEFVKSSDIPSPLVKRWMLTEAKGILQRCANIQKWG